MANVKLTSRYHLRYMGLWIVVCLVQIVVIDALLYRLLDDYLGGLVVDEAGGGVRGLVLWPIVLLTVISFAGIVALGILTAHRIAGPYLALCQACRRIATGQGGHRLQFRQYDNLDEVAEEFNQMVDALQASRVASGSERSATADPARPTGQPAAST